MSADSATPNDGETTADQKAADQQAGKEKAGAPDSDRAASKIDAKRAARSAELADADRGGREFTINSRTLVKAAAALLAIAAIVVIGVLSWQYAEKSRTLRAFDESKAASRAFVTTYFETMMAPGATPEQVKAKISPLTTGEARDRVDADATTNTKWAADAKFTNPKIVVNSATVESFSADKATTVLASTLTVSSAAAPAGAEQVFLLQLDMVRENGKWLVGRMIPVPGVSSTQSPGAPAQQSAPANPAPAPAPAPAPGG